MLNSPPRSRAVSVSSVNKVEWYRDPHRLRTAGIELAITVALMVLYFLIRGQRPDDVDAAVARSLAIVHFEQQVGIFAEVRWQEFFLPHEPIMKVANFIYAWGHYPVMAAIAVWLALKDASRFRFMRNVMLVSALIGIASYYVLPAAPPRLMEIHGYDFGFVDTVHNVSSNVSYFQPSLFVNDYAAVPSFHFGWIALSSAAIWANTNNRWVKAGAVTMSVVMWWAVTVTGNHYFFDMIMGGVVVGLLMDARNGALPGARRHQGRPRVRRKRAGAARDFAPSVIRGPFAGQCAPNVLLT